jgi:protein subunit release factor A
MMIHDFRPEEIRIDTCWRGMGRGSLMRITHLPTGTVVQSEIPHRSEEVHVQTRDRLLNDLRARLPPGRDSRVQDR